MSAVPRLGRRLSKLDPVINPAALQMVLGVLIGWLERRERETIGYRIE